MQNNAMVTFDLQYARTTKFQISDNSRILYSMGLVAHGCVLVSTHMAATEILENKGKR